MKISPILIAGITVTLVTGCGTSTPSQRGTLAELQNIEPDVKEVYLEDSLEMAAESYRRYLDETPEGELTPEAMRRLADLQIEQQYGVLGTGELIEMEAPESAPPVAVRESRQKVAVASEPGESEQAFEQRATQRQELLAASPEFQGALPTGHDDQIPTGPREAIETYKKILENYPNYERNDQVLYQMSRAYDEIGQPDEAMLVMDRFITEYKYSKYVDEVHFRRGEYFFVRKKYRDAEEAYAPILQLGAESSYYELALYKLGWTLYKQDMYEEALHNFIAMLDFRKSIGFDFDAPLDQKDEHRVTDTFRVVSLSFSNLGGPEVIDDYFADRGRRSYADKIYGNLGEFYFEKLRYDDAASVYKSFIRLNEFHKASPHFSMRVIDIYTEAGFPQLVVESKKDFSIKYSLDADYWSHFDSSSSEDVVGFLKANLTDLANHYHALYQDENLADERPDSFDEAQRWYREFLKSFPKDEESPVINYQLADLLLENGNYGEAASAYEATAYDYDSHDKAAAAGYAAVFAHREDLKAASGASTLEIKKATVASSLRFADTFPEHEQAPVVLGAAADDLYDMQEFGPAIEAAHNLIGRYPSADTELLRSAWAVVAHSSIDLANYTDAERAYLNVLGLTPDDDESRPAIVDGLAASIYKQGEQARLLEDYETAAQHFLRVKEAAPTSTIRTAAEYDGAAALMTLESWSRAASVLEEFRVDNPEHELAAEATKHLAVVYREDGQLERSAQEHENIAAGASDPELGREALLTAGDLYDEAGANANTIRVYEQYVAEYPRPLDVAMETRNRLAEIFKSDRDFERYHRQLEQIVATDLEAGTERTARSRYLAAHAALVLAKQSYEQFAVLKLVQPFEQSLTEKQQRMDKAMEIFEKLVEYEVADVTAAATYHIAEIYLNFSESLMASERPQGLSESEKVDYEMVIEEEAYPFEERAIEVHEQNIAFIATGVFNTWVRQSLDKLTVLMPGRYAKNEISGGFVGSIDTYAYRMPIAPQPALDDADENDVLQPDDDSESAKSTAQLSTL